MPTIEISFSDLQKLVGKKQLPSEPDKLTELLACVKGEVESFEGDTVSINIADGNRPDLWCAEGIARALKGALGEHGLPHYPVESSDYRVFVNGKLEKIRGFIACAVVKGVKLTGQIITQLMQQQEKLDATYGRNRKRTSIGLYNFDLLKWPLKYTLTKHHENAFVPLGYEDKLAPHEILKTHPKGVEYGHLLEGLSEYPIFLDNAGKVLSMPPIINSADLGQVNEKTENILVEVTGTDYNAVQNILRVITLSLADRGGKIYFVQIDYPFRKIDNTPHLETQKITVEIPKVNELLGTKFDAKEITVLLQKMRYNVKPIPEMQAAQSLEIEAPAYRSDLMHVVDVYEDIAIAYGYNRFEPEVPGLPTAGKVAAEVRLANKIRELCVGLGAQEILTFNLTNKDNLFRLMGTKEEKVIEVDNPASFTFSCLRNKLLPSILEFLSKNTTKEFPQKIFEVGDVVYPDSSKDEMSTTEKRLCFAVSHSEVTFTEAKQALEAVYANLGKKIAIKEADHDSFIVGRCAAVYAGKEKLGIIGEIHPQILQNWGLEQPVVAFEVKI